VTDEGRFDEPVNLNLDGKSHRAHARQRLMERYGVVCSILQLEEQIKTRQARFIIGVPGASIYRVKLPRGGPAYAVYNGDIIMTFYTKEMVDEVILRQRNFRAMLRRLEGQG